MAKDENDLAGMRSESQPITNGNGIDIKPPTAPVLGSSNASNPGTFIANDCTGTMVNPVTELWRLEENNK